LATQLTHTSILQLLELAYTLFTSYASLQSYLSRTSIIIISTIIFAFIVQRSNQKEIKENAYAAVFVNYIANAEEILNGRK